MPAQSPSEPGIEVRINAGIGIRGPIIYLYLESQQCHAGRPFGAERSTNVRTIHPKTCL